MNTNLIKLLLTLGGISISNLLPLTAFSQPLELTSRGSLYYESLNLIIPPDFNAGIRIKANGVDLKTDTYASVPCVVDWNGDGKKDLLVGCFYYGNVYLYLNSGTNSSPVFTTGAKLQAGGVDISVAYG